MQTSLEFTLNSLNGMSYAELVKSWQDAFHKPPPTQCGRALLCGALAWHIQAQQIGNLSPSELKSLSQSTSSSSKTTNLSAGSRLVRVWEGQTHQVTVLDNGFEYLGRHWESLSAIARAITGTRWSGPVFFGVKKSGGR